MEHQIFISHHSKDKDIAAILASFIKDFTKGNVQFWYSSDSSPEGGMCVGNIIFNEIIKRLNESDATIVLLTPRSVNKPWLLFESGMAQGRENQYVIPVCVGINKDTISQPLNNYYCYQLSDVDSLSEFVSKLLGRMKYYPKVKDSELQRFISALQEASRSLMDNENNDNNRGNIDFVDEIKVHIDRRILSLAQSLNEIELTPKITYTIPISIGFGKKRGSVGYIEINPVDSVQSILDKIFYLLDGEVKAYTYLSSWVLREKRSGALMIIYEITNLIPANSVFRPDFEWEVIEWCNNYDPCTSKYRVGFYPNL